MVDMFECISALEVFFGSTYIYLNPYHDVFLIQLLYVIFLLNYFLVAVVIYNSKAQRTGRLKNGASIAQLPIKCPQHVDVHK
jgi:hypothetical protein